MQVFVAPASRRHFSHCVETRKIADETPALRKSASLRELDELRFADRIRPEKFTLGADAHTGKHS
jgi:hypothetical protein